MRNIALFFILLNVAVGDDMAFDSHVRTVIRSHCVKCHGASADPEADLNLQAIGQRSDLVGAPQLAANLIESLDSHAMPPDREPELPIEKRKRFIDVLKGVLVDAASRSEMLPRTSIRRMNRFQYSNAVQDLFDLNVEVFALPERMMREYNGYFQPASREMPPAVNVGSRPLGKSQLIAGRLAGVAPFPQDLRAENGFDNRADHLSLSPLLMESFLHLSRSIVDSPDFDSKCGIYAEFFGAPNNDGDMVMEVRDRLRPFLRRAFRRPPTDM